MALVLVVCIVSTMAMTGLIWFVQVVHYPLLASIGDKNFAEYQRRNVRLTTYVVLPFMAVELLSSLLLMVQPVPQFEVPLQLAGVATLLIWLSTFFLQVPQHRILETSFNERAWQRLVWTNWIRTILWSTRTILMCWVMMG